MPVSIVLAVLATVVVTGGLTLLLSRMNQPRQRDEARPGGDASTIAATSAAGGGKTKPDHDLGDGVGDGGGDGGAD